MKKNYFYALFATLMLCMAMPATAQITSVSGFYGKWQFTADVDVKDQEYADLFSNSCEVIITKGDDGYPAKMEGFAGSTQTLSINKFDADAQTLLFLNPNSPQLWAPLHMADATGKYPYGTQAESWQDMYSSINFTYDAATGVLTYPDFTAVTVDHATEGAEVKVKVSNIKMTLIEAEEIVVPEIAGEWSYTPYYAKNDSNFVKNFKMTLVATDETNTKWDATFAFEGFSEFTLPATFDGVTLDIPFDNLYLDAEQKIRFGIGATKSTPENVFVKSGKFSFSYNSKTLMYQNDYIYIRQEGVDTAGVEVAPIIQQLRGGWIEREDPNAYDWAGTYQVNITNIEDLNANDGVEFPSSFEMAIEKSMGSFYVTKFLGYEGTSIEMIPNEDGKSATLNLGGYGGAMLQFLGEVTVGESTDYAYHVITDINGEATTLNVLLNEDGSLSFADFTVSYKLYYANSYEPLAIMTGVSATKAEAAKFEWVGEYTLTAEKVDVYYTGDDVAFPETFDVTIEYFDGTEYGMESFYYIGTFMNKNIAQMPIDLKIAEDGWSAEMLVGGMCGAIVPGESYYKIYDMNATNSPITITANADGSISIPSFFIKVLNYNDNTEAAGAFYQNVTLTRKSTGIENIVETPVVEGIYDLLGRKIEAITAPGLYIVNGKKVVIK